VSAGGAHTVAFKSDGSLWSWGRNGYGQLGLGYSSWWEDKTTPASVSAEGGWVSVSAATFRTMALKDDGSVWAWGWNETWGLGNDSEAQQNSPVQVGSAKDWVAVRAAGNSYHNIALKGDGGLWTWGDNWQGQLGSGVFEEHAYVPARVGYAENWAAVAPGFYHSMALQSDGSLWTWGHNWFGQLGDGHYGMYAEDWRCEPYWVGAGFRLPD
jgi:alpha-tubulin suppressor-like RCC1 family protein